MTQRTKYLLIFFFLVGLHNYGHAQNNEQWQLSVEEVEEYKAQSQSLISFFEGTLNFLGDPASTVQEKEIVIEESYAKIGILAFITFSGSAVYGKEISKEASIEVHDGMDFYRFSGRNNCIFHQSFCICRKQPHLLFLGLCMLMSSQQHFLFRLGCPLS